MPPACPVPQFPQSDSICLRCQAQSSTKGLAAAAFPQPRDAPIIGTGHRCQQRDPGGDAHHPSSCPHMLLCVSPPFCLT